MSEPRSLPGFEAQTGLCSVCRFGRRQASPRGSRFWRCSLADRDPRFARYPPLPVRSCPGFEPDAKG